MIRVLVSLSGIVSLVAADRAAAMSLPVEAPTPPAVNCEQPGNATAAPAPVSEADKSGIGCQLGEGKGTGRARELVAAPDPAEQEAIREMLDLREVSSIMHQFATHTETFSQMEAWWRERSEFGEAAQDKPAPSTTKEALAQMDAWWRERTDLHNGIAPEQSPSAVKEAIAQMDAWWQQRAELGHVSLKNPAPAAHHRPVKWVFSRARTAGHRQSTTPTVEYGCPPSVCTIQYDNQ